MAKKAKKRITKTVGRKAKSKKKVAKKSSRKVAKKTTKKTSKKAAKKTGKKTGRKTSKKAGKKKKSAASGKSSAQLPKVGQTVKWKALPGMVEGTVVAVLTKDGELNGKKVKASKEAPRIKLKSNTSGKLCVHKPENVHPA